MSKPELLSVKDAAARLGVSVPRIHQLIKENRLPAAKVGRDYIISSDDLTGDILDRPTGRPPKEKEDK